MKQLLMTAKNEIERQRRELEILRAQMAVVDVFAAATGLRRNESVCMSVDVAWLLEKEIEEMERKEAEPRTGVRDEPVQVDDKKEQEVFLPKADQRGQVLNAAGQVNRWNLECPEGTKVVVTLEEGGERETVTTSAAWLLEGKIPVVMLNGLNEAQALVAVRPA